MLAPAASSCAFQSPKFKSRHCSYTAVSYTHLDVYKRQLQQFRWFHLRQLRLLDRCTAFGRDAPDAPVRAVTARVRIARLIVPDHRIEPVAQIPVSYTHLDVYKRQLPIQAQQHRELGQLVGFKTQVRAIHLRRDLCLSLIHI